jgi:hypothetical protein
MRALMCDLLQWVMTGNEYAVLSTYVHHIDRLPINHLHNDVPLICRTKWGEGGMVRNEQVTSARTVYRCLVVHVCTQCLARSQCCC